MEALITARQGLVQPEISLPETAIGAALFFPCVFAVIYLPLSGNNHRDPDFPLKLWSCGLGMWALLGGAMAAAGLGQWRIRRRTVNLVD